MSKPFFLFCFTLSICTNIFAQKHFSNFIMPEFLEKIPNSPYKAIRFIDSRLDTANASLSETQSQLTALLSSAIDNSAKDGELLLQLRTLNFSEVMENDSRQGRGFLRAALYSNNSGRYQKIASIDTLFNMRGSIGATKGSLKSAGELIEDFVINNLFQRHIDSSYLELNDIDNINSIEKQKIPVYNDSIFIDGIYSTYQSFMNQIPDTAKQIAIVKMTDSETISSIKSIENGRNSKIHPKEVYAVVYKGVPFIATKYGFYKARKINGDLFFTGNILTNTEADDVAMAGVMMGGAASIASAAMGQRNTFQMKIDYLNGNFIRLKHVYHVYGIEDN